MENDQKVALITGANKGIGWEIARQLGKSGLKVIVSGRNRERVTQAVEKLKKMGLDVLPLLMDVGDAKSIQRAFESIRTTITRIDILVNNAGIAIDEDKPLLDFLPEEVLETFSVNAFGPFFVTQKFLPLIPRGGRVINISSSAGSICRGVSSYAPLYSASKTAENALTLHLAQALKAKDIAVNLVCPGWVRTDMGGPRATRSLEEGAETPVWLATEAPQHLTGRFLRDKKETAL